MTGPADKPGADADRSSTETSADDASTDNGSDHDTSVGPADADESGYRRDDYWRAAQEGRDADAGADAMRQRDAVSDDRNETSGGSGVKPPEDGGS